MLLYSAPHARMRVIAFSARTLGTCMREMPVDRLTHYHAAMAGAAFHTVSTAYFYAGHIGGSGVLARRQNTSRRSAASSSRARRSLPFPAESSRSISRFHGFICKPSVNLMPLALSRASLG